EDGIRDFHVTEFRRVLFRSPFPLDSCRVLRETGDSGNFINGSGHHNQAQRAKEHQQCETWHATSRMRSGLNFQISVVSLRRIIRRSPTCLKRRSARRWMGSLLIALAIWRSRRTPSWLLSNCILLLMVQGNRVTPALVREL